jgi:DNA helicase-2/ATP-dependent DNA helicase PcrA
VFDYLKELNKAQYEAVVNTEGPALVIAGAGSGKTRVLTYRIAHLLKRGVRPSSILALTFTNKAAREMKDRITGVVGEEKARYLWMGTFHSVFARILRREHEITGYPHNFTIFDSADSKSLIKSVIKSLKLDEKIYKPGIVASRISMAKNNLITPALYARNTDIRLIDSRMQMPMISEIYREYTKRSFLSGAMDFDDLLLKTNHLFRDNPAILEKYQSLFSYLLVDEYQDTNYSQYLIVKKLAQRHHNLCVVGDDAQSIYSFRGARIENILSFQNDYPDHKIFKLEQNYRSTRIIVDAANSIIAKNKRQIPKIVFSEKEKGRLIKVISALTDNEEGFLVAREIAETQLREHYKNKDYAILYRTNAQSRIFEEALRKRNIPYKIYGGLSFYQRKEIKDLIAFFRIIVNPWDNEALKRIINIPSRGIGQTTISRLENSAVSMEISIWKIIEGLSEDNPAGLNKGTITKIGHFAEMIREFMKVAAECDAFKAAGIIAEKTGILREMSVDSSPEGVSRYENIQELLNGIREFSLNALEEGLPGKLSDFLEDVSLLTDQDTDKDEDRDKVTLMTVHSAKGLEFRNVFVVGLEERLFPSLQSDEKKSSEPVEEERRLFYVALTRAGENVWLSYANQRYRWGKPDFCTPSRFLTEIDKKYMDGDNIMEKSFAGREINPVQFRNSLGKHDVKNDNFQSASKPYRTEIIRNRIKSHQASDNADNGFEGDDQEKIVQGMIVEHQRFGTGKVLRVEGVSPDKKAFVFFQNAGNKQLLLKFAKLKIVG